MGGSSKAHQRHQKQGNSSEYPLKSMCHDDLAVAAPPYHNPVIPAHSLSPGGTTAREPASIHELDRLTSRPHRARGYGPFRTSLSQSLRAIGLQVRSSSPGRPYSVVVLGSFGRSEDVAKQGLGEAPPAYPGEGSGCSHAGRHQNNCAVPRPIFRAAPRVAGSDPRSLQIATRAEEAGKIQADPRRLISNSGGGLFTDIAVPDDAPEQLWGLCRPLPTHCRHQHLREIICPGA
jgi:hypothetical protein